MYASAESAVGVSTVGTITPDSPEASNATAVVFYNELATLMLNTGDTPQHAWFESVCPTSQGLLREQCQPAARLCLFDMWLLSQLKHPVCCYFAANDVRGSLMLVSVCAVNRPGATHSC